MRDGPPGGTMTRLMPTAWWRGLGGLTRSGSAAEGLSWAPLRLRQQGAMSDRTGRRNPYVAILSLLVLMLIGFLIVRRVPEGAAHPDQERQLGTPLEPAIVPPGEMP